MSSSHGPQITVPGLYVLGDLSAKQYHAVKLASTANVVVALTATTEVAVGVLQDAPDASGEAAKVAGLGGTVMVAGTSTITAGEQVGYDSTGRAVDGNAINFGIALEASGAVGDEIRVLLTGINQ